MKKHVKACATLLVAFSLFLGASGTHQAKADENLIGFTSDFARLYINSDDKLGVASTEFVNDETTTLFSIDGKPQLLSQFAVAAIFGAIPCFSATCSCGNQLLCKRTYSTYYSK